LLVVFGIVWLLELGRLLDAYRGDAADLRRRHHSVRESGLG
jgi:hypothetical protein